MNYLCGRHLFCFTASMDLTLEGQGVRAQTRRQLKPGPPKNRRVERPPMQPLRLGPTITLFESRPNAGPILLSPYKVFQRCNYIMPLGMIGNNAISTMSTISVVTISNIGDIYSGMAIGTLSLWIHHRTTSRPLYTRWPWSQLAELSLTGQTWCPAHGTTGRVAM